ncbi:MAG: hypothetical protein IJD45_07255 [Clostridia bacterium]|nr:hypothetical protein [Clostridia bacterium]
MDFFDNALNKAKEALEIVSQKTEEVVATGKQKYNIATLENQCNKSFKALGQLYYNKAKDTEIEDTEIKFLVDSISQTKAEIEAIKKELESEK